MKSISYTEARAKLAFTMDQVCIDHDPIIITRSQAKPVIMISLEDYEALEETNYLLRSPTNAKRIASSILEIEKMIRAKKKKNK